MTHDEHRTLHGELIHALDELLADYWLHHPLKYKSEAVRRLVESELTARDLIEWAHQQSVEPSESGETVHSISVCAHCGARVEEFAAHFCNLAEVNGNVE